MSFIKTRNLPYFHQRHKHGGGIFDIALQKGRAERDAREAQKRYEEQQPQRDKEAYDARVKEDNAQMYRDTKKNLLNNPNKERIVKSILADSKSPEWLLLLAKEIQDK
jgi:hypothetical protein